MTGHLFFDRRLPGELDALVRSELRPGEPLLWVGQPQPVRFMLPAIPMVLCGIPWIGLSLFWVGWAAGPIFDGNGGLGLVGVLFPLFGVPFVAVGLGMLSSPF